MLLGENITLAITSLKSNKMRALLTMLGIIIGIASVMLGAGREKKDDTIDMSAGIIMHKKTNLN